MAEASIHMTAFAIFSNFLSQQSSALRSFGWWPLAMDLKKWLKINAVAFSEKLISPPRQKCWTNDPTLCISFCQRSFPLQCCHRFDRAAKDTNCSNLSQFRIEWVKLYHISFVIHTNCRRSTRGRNQNRIKEVHNNIEGIRRFVADFQSIIKY